MHGSSIGAAGHDERAQNANWQKVLVVDTASHYAKPDVSIEGHWCPSIDTSGLTHVIHMLRLADPSFRPISPRIGAPTSRSAGSILDVKRGSHPFSDRVDQLSLTYKVDAGGLAS
jgi:hypothetical protein